MMRKLLQKNTIGLLLMLLALFSCSKKKTTPINENPEHLHGDYILNRVTIAGYDLPQYLGQNANIILDRYLSELTKNLNDHQKRAAVYIMSEVAKSFQTYAKNNPNDITEESVISQTIDIPTIVIYDAIYNYQETGIYNSMIEQFTTTLLQLATAIPLNVNSLTFISAIKHTDPNVYFSYAQQGDVLPYGIADKEGLYIIDQHTGGMEWFNDHDWIQDQLIPMLIRMLFNHTTTIALAKEIKHWIIEEGATPQVAQFFPMIREIPRVIIAATPLSTLLAILQPQINQVNTYLNIIHSNLYGDFVFNFRNNNAMNFSFLASNVYEKQAALTFHSTDQKSFSAHFLANPTNGSYTNLPASILHFKKVRQEENDLHLALKDVNGMASLLGMIKEIIKGGITTKPKIELDIENILTILQAVENNIYSFADNAVERHEHLLLNLLIDKPSQCPIVNFIPQLQPVFALLGNVCPIKSAKPSAREEIGATKDVIILELEKI